MNEKKARLVNRLFGVAGRRGGARVRRPAATMLFLLAAAAGAHSSAALYGAASGHGYRAHQRRTCRIARR